MRRRIGYVAQGGTTNPACTVAQELLLQARLYRVPDAGARAKELMERFGLADRPIGALSGGQKRRLDIVHTPPVAGCRRRQETATGVSAPTADSLIMRKSSDPIQMPGGTVGAGHGPAGRLRLGGDAGVDVARHDASREARCVFCAIIAGRAPARVIRTWPGVIAIRPRHPVTAGHVLVIPRAHVSDVGVDPAVSAEAMAAAAELAGGLEAANIITSRGAAATQTILHVHLHVVPRERGDGLPLPWTSPAALLVGDA